MTTTRRPTTPLATELAPAAGALRSGARWVADSFVPLALSRAVTAAAQVLADEAADATPVRRKNLLEEAGTRTWLGRNRSRVLPLASEAVEECWQAVGGRGGCPVELLGFGLRGSTKSAPDDLVLRYRIGGTEHQMWINHKWAKAESTGVSRVGSIRALAGAAIGARVARWEQVVPALSEALSLGRHLASLVLVFDTTGDGIEVMCYEPFTVYAYWDREVVGGAHPDDWPVRELRTVASVYAPENGLVQAEHHSAAELYPMLALGLVAAGVPTTDVVRRGAGRMIEHDAVQRRELARAADERLAGFMDAAGYTLEDAGAAPQRPGTLGLAVGGRVRPLSGMLGKVADSGTPARRAGAERHGLVVAA